QIRQPPCPVDIGRRDPDEPRGGSDLRGPGLERGRIVEREPKALLGRITCPIDRSAAEQEVPAENLELGQEDRAAATAEELDSDVDRLEAAIMLPGQEGGAGLQVAEHGPEARRRPGTELER